MTKTIGILGGMGTYATLHFLNTLVDLAKPDEFRFILDNATHILERTKAVKEKREDEVERGIINNFLDLRSTPIDFVVAPCNQLHYWHSRIDGMFSFPWLNMIEIVSDAVKAKGFKHPLILGGYVTVMKKLYSKYLPGAVYPDEEIQGGISALISGLKNVGTRQPGLIGTIGEVIRKHDHEIDCVIMACTELSILQLYDIAGYEVIDSSLELAKATIKYARGK